MRKIKFLTNAVKTLKDNTCFLARKEIREHMEKNKIGMACAGTRSYYNDLGIDINDADYEQWSKALILFERHKTLTVGDLINYEV